MADEYLRTTTRAAEGATDDDCRSLDADVNCIADTGATAAEPSSSTGVAFVDMPTSVLEVSDLEYNDEEEEEEEEENDLPYPGYVEKAFFYFLQTTRPRNWCLQLITWPYPFCTYCTLVHELVPKNFDRHTIQYNTIQHNTIQYSTVQYADL